VAFSKDGRLLASGSADKTARIWNVESGEMIKIIQPESPITLKLQARILNLKRKMPVTSVAFSPDGKSLAIGTGRVISLLDVLTGNTLRVFEGHEQSVSGVAFLPEGDSLASSSLDGTIRLWSPL
jgi:glucose repression regulatory protein TUP1